MIRIGPFALTKRVVNRNLYLGIAFILTAGVLWGAMGTAVQYLYAVPSGFSAISLVTLRQLSAGVVFLAAASLFDARRIWSVLRNKRDAFDIALSGVLLFSAHHAYFEAIFYSNAGTAAIFLATVPLLCGLWSTVRHGKPMTMLELICFVLAIAGVALIVTDGDWKTLQFSPWALFWGMVSAIAAAAYSIQPLAVIARRGVVPVVAWGMLTAGIVASILCPPWTIKVAWDAAVAANFGYIVLFGTVLAFWAYLSGLKYITPVIAGLLNCAEPLTAFLFSALLLGDRLSFMQSLGVALVLGNIVLLALGKSRR